MATSLRNRAKLFRLMLHEGLIPRASLAHIACCGALAVLCALPATAEIKTKTLPDGTTLIYNENETQRARRTADRLLQVPRSDIDHWIDYYARHHGMNRRLVQAVVQVESGYNAKAVSSKGAMGLMQLMPDTARMLGVRDAFDPQDNIRGGTTYLRRMNERFGGDLTLALAAYNAGPKAVEQYGGVPPYRETRNYVRKVFSLYRGTVPSAWQEHARDLARERHKVAKQAAAEQNAKRGEKVYVTRDANNRVLLTTKPPTSP